MRLSKLFAEGVHGYLPISINFNSDLTFLTGLNGSGKTSALRLISALLTPNLEELVSINFSYAAITVFEGIDSFTVAARRTKESIEVSLDEFQSALTISATDMQFLVDAKYRRNEPSPALEIILSHPVVERIRSLPTPMYLGIDRRAVWALGTEEYYGSRRPLGAQRRQSIEEEYRGSTNIGGITEVSDLLKNKWQEIRAEEVKLDDALRIQLFTKAFEYKPGSFLEGGLKAPTRAEVAQYKTHLENFERDYEALHLPAPELRAALSSFFDSMNKVVIAMEKLAEREKFKQKPQNRGSTLHGPKRSRWEDIPKPVQEPVEPDRDLIEWWINSPQADRVMKSLELLDNYVKARNALNKPIDRFVSLVNGFLQQTSKSLSVTHAGNISISFKHGEEVGNVNALSSGERQLVVMLAHLSLNPHLGGSGIFIVDEPELSLHIDWQEKFVDAVIQANPNVQVVLATHSPAIILDRHFNCVDAV